MLHLSQNKKKYLNELVDQRLEKIADLDKKVNSNDLIYRYKVNIAEAKFDKFDNALDIIDKIRDGKIDLSNVKNNQENDIEMLYKARNEAITFYDGYSSMMSEAKK